MNADIGSTLRPGWVQLRPALLAADLDMGLLGPVRRFHRSLRVLFEPTVAPR